MSFEGDKKTAGLSATDSRFHESNCEASRAMPHITMTRYMSSLLNGILFWTSQGRKPIHPLCCGD